VRAGRLQRTTVSFSCSRGSAAGRVACRDQTARAGEAETVRRRVDAGVDYGVTTERR
jgi:hypothetical protein